MSNRRPAQQTQSSSLPPPEWPPPWARTIAFFVGIALTGYESVVDHAAHLVVFGPAFLLTGLPIAKGVDKILDKLPWGSSAQPPPRKGP